MKKLISSVILAAAVLFVVPAWAGSDRHDSRHQDKQYAMHHDKHSGKQHYRKHWKKHQSHNDTYRHGRRYFKKHHYRGRHYYPSLYSHSPYGYDNGIHWGVVFRYFD